MKTEIKGLRIQSSVIPKPELTLDEWREFIKSQRLLMIIKRFKTKNLHEYL